MNDNIKAQLEATITSCAIKAQETVNAIDALQYTQAALNAANAIVCLANQKR